MGLKKVIFSATGGTEKVADILIKGLDESAEKIDLLDMYNLHLEGKLISVGD